MKYCILLVALLAVACESTQKSEPIEPIEPKGEFALYVVKLPPTAKLPRQLQEITVETMQPGESGWVSITKFAVDSENRAWIAKNGEIRVVKTQPSKHWIRIRRTKKGLVVLIKNMRFSNKRALDYNYFLPLARVATTEQEFAK